MEGVSQNSGFVIGSHACRQVTELARGDQGKELFLETPLEGNGLGALLGNSFPPFFQLLLVDVQVPPWWPALVHPSSLSSLCVSVRLPPGGCSSRGTVEGTWSQTGGEGWECMLTRCPLERTWGGLSTSNNLVCGFLSCVNLLPSMV